MMRFLKTFVAREFVNRLNELFARVVLWVRLAGVQNLHALVFI